MQRERPSDGRAPCCALSTAAAVASVKLLIQPHARQTIAAAAHRNPTAAEPAHPPIASTESGDPGYTHLVGDRSSAFDNNAGVRHRTRTIDNSRVRHVW